MSKTAIIHARIEPKLKAEVEAILEKFGLNTTDAVTLFYKQVKHFKGLPFDVRIPNKETIKAIEEANKDAGLKRFGSVRELMKDLDS